jgi:uncharacterized membrane protein YheB (UPF0754 family)
MNAIDILKEDHNVVEALFQKAEEAAPKEQAVIFKDIRNELETHAHVEEKIFYPALKRAGDKESKDLVLEGFEEHHHMKMSLAEISKTRPSSERFSPKLKVMIEMVRHHVKEEEGVGGMFSMARDHFDEAELEKLGKRIENEKAKFMKENRIKPVDRQIARGPIDTMIEKAKDLVGQIIPGDGGEGRTKKGSKGSTKGRQTASKARSAKA